MGGLECGSSQGCVRNTPSDAEDLTGHQLKAGRRPRAPERNVQILAKPGRVKEETEQDQTCTRDSRWGWGDRSRGPIPRRGDCSGHRAIGGSWRAQQLIGDSPQTVLPTALHTWTGTRVLWNGAGAWGLESNPRAGSAVDCGEVARADLREESAAGSAVGGRPGSRGGQAMLLGHARGGTITAVFLSPRGRCRWLVNRGPQRGWHSVPDVLSDGEGPGPGVPSECPLC